MRPYHERRMQKERTSETVGFPEGLRALGSVPLWVWGEG